jgi:serralysin
VKYFSGFNNLNNWPGNLLENQGDSVLFGKTATSVSILHGADHPFAGFKVIFSGTGFVYDGNDVIAGTLTSVTIKNALGQNILQITGLNATTVASDITSIIPLIMGFTNPDDPNPSTEAKAAWSQLMMGDDTITGTSGDDRSLIGVDGGNDTYNMGLGNDFISGGIGNDIYNGGDGFDTLSFSETNYNEGMTAIRGINVNMVTGTLIDAWGGTDTLNSIEEILGSRFRDTFLGGDANETFSGGRGADVIDGGNGRDWASYRDDVWSGGTRGINANLTTGIIVDGFGTRDSVINIERVEGTRYNDRFVGDAGRNMFAGGEGLDYYNGASNVNDVFQGDVINFGRSFAGGPLTGINVDLSLATNQIINDGFNNVETAVGIEGIFGTYLNDTIRGNNAKNIIAGGDGLDTLTGGGSNDVFEFWGQGDAGDGDVVTDFVVTQDKLGFDTFGYNNMTGLIIENDMTADTASGTFLFNTTSKILYWDENGSGAGGQYAIVTLNNVVSLSTTNFELYF